MFKFGANFHLIETGFHRVTYTMFKKKSIEERSF